MKPENVTLAAFFVLAVGLPLVAMQFNGFSSADINNCSGSCYDEWKEETGGFLAVQQAIADAKAAASPEELGKSLYAGCVACHGGGGEGGIGPMLAGQSSDDIAGKLNSYKAGETLGAQSALMWAQAKMLSDDDIDNLAAFISSL